MKAAYLRDEAICKKLQHLTASWPDRRQIVQRAVHDFGIQLNATLRQRASERGPESALIGTAEAGDIFACNYSTEYDAFMRNDDASFIKSVTE